MAQAPLSRWPGTWPSTTADPSAAHRTEQAFGSHGPEQPLQRDFHVLPPGHRALELQAKPGPAGMRTDRLEADGEQVIGGQDAVPGFPP